MTLRESSEYLPVLLPSSCELSRDPALNRLSYVLFRAQSKCKDKENSGSIVIVQPVNDVIIELGLQALQEAIEKDHPPRLGKSTSLS